MKRIMGFFLALVMFLGCLPLNPIASYANGDVEINDKNFPDKNFREYVKRNFDKNPCDGKLSKDELDKVTEISIKYQSDSSLRVSSLKGIEHFKNLKKLSCSYNYIKEFDVSKNKNLNKLDCSGNQLESLDVSKNTALKELYCSNNNLTNLDVSKNTALEKLYCESNNNLTNLDVSKNTALEQLDCHCTNLSELDVSKNTNLTYLSCSNNNLTNLDVSKNTALKKLYCYGNNNLTNLDVSKNTALKILYCYSNNLSELNVRNNTDLTELDCSYNNLTNLDVSKNTALEQLECQKNKLTKLDVSKNTALTKLRCNHNNLASLDVSNNKNLKELNCSENKLTSLDVRNNKNLTKLTCNHNNLTSLDLSNNKNLKELNCSENKLTSLDVRNNKNLTKLTCNHNNLTSLDLSNNKKLTSLDCSNQQYNITVNKGIREFKYSEFPGKFNKDKVISPVGANFGDDALTVNSDTPSKVTYKYKVDDNREMDVELNVTYFDPENVVDMKVKTQPTKLSYTEGEKLDLTGLVVTLADKNKTTRDVAFAEFTTYEITTDPENGAYLTLTDNNKPVTISKGSLKAETKNLTVNKKETPSPLPTPKNPPVVGPVDPTDSNGGKPADTSKYWTVTFKSEDETKGTVDAKNTVYVLKTENKTLADITAPEKTAKAGYEFDKWEPALNNATTINKDMTVKAYFKASGTIPTPKNPPVVGPVDSIDSNTKKSQVANNRKLPKTANSMNIELYTIFMILSGALLVVAFKRKKRVNR